jgi:hypothetical protein
VISGASRNPEENPFGAHGPAVRYPTDEPVGIVPSKTVPSSPAVSNRLDAYLACGVESPAVGTTPAEHASEGLEVLDEGGYHLTPAMLRRLDAWAWGAAVRTLFQVGTPSDTPSAQQPLSRWPSTTRQMIGAS